MSAPSVTQQSLFDYSALPVLRKSIAAKAAGVVVTNFDHSPIDLTFLLQQAESSPNHVFRQRKPKPTSSAAASPFDPRLDASFRALHALATALFNNLSHVLELPWEKYLAEMHEYSAPGDDELCLIPHGSDLTNAWSTITLIIDPEQPHICHVAYGEALTVLSENQVASATSLPLSSNAGRLLAYYVRLNDDTYYTRTAGALMTPLSDKEYHDRRTVGELRLVEST